MAAEKSKDFTETCQERQGRVTLARNLEGHKKSDTSSGQAESVRRGTTFMMPRGCTGQGRTGLSP